MTKFHRNSHVLFGISIRDVYGASKNSSQSSRLENKTPCQGVWKRCCGPALSRVGQFGATRRAPGTAVPAYTDSVRTTN